MDSPTDQAFRGEEAGRAGKKKKNMDLGWAVCLHDAHRFLCGVFGNTRLLKGDIRLTANHHLSKIRL